MHPIFDPFKKCHGKDVIIVTWNIAPPHTMPDVMKQLKQASAVALFVGYSKISHNLPQLKTLMMQYKDLGWYVHGLPNCHSKLWLIGNELWVGSANWCSPTLMNFMMPTGYQEAFDHLDEIIALATSISESSDLKLLKQATVKSDLEPCIF